MAGVACIHGEGRMSERLKQVRLCRLMRIVTVHAVGSCERLTLMRLDQAGVLRVVTIQTKLRCSLRQVVIKFRFPSFPSLVSDVASLTTHIQSRVPASLIRCICPLCMTCQTEVLVLVTGRRFE